VIILLSPAKTLDFESPTPKGLKSTQPRFLDNSKDLVNILKDFSSNDLQKLMGVSEKIGNLNSQRFHDWSPPFKKSNAKAALFAFKGDVYVGLDAESLKVDQLNYAQEHLRLLSGLYGILKPLDLIQPYRLEMGTKLQNTRGKNLYDFWGSTLTESINQELKKGDLIINLASQEYFKSLKRKELQGKLISPEFKDFKNGQYKIISFFAKKARGMMARFLIDKKINDEKGLKKFNLDGYKYSQEHSKEDQPVFIRNQE
jgi:cytoplasmic iron level regulating protein YaaA (DUF328/UPF0246 family)